MARIHYISGGERSGKSSFAQEVALKLSSSPIYIATSRRFDGDTNFDKRILRHQNDRDERWRTIEEEKHLGRLDLNGEVVVIDCVTLWLTNWFIDSKQDVDVCLMEAKRELEDLFDRQADIFIVSNEIGMGVHAQTETGRRFTELQGWINQFIARKADRATFMVSGLPMELK